MKNSISCYFFFAFFPIYSIINLWWLVMDYSSEKELFNDLKGALKVKLRIIKEKYDYISMLDIWNYLKLNKWRYDQNLTISEMVNDIIDVDIIKVDTFIKSQNKKED